MTNSKNKATSQIERIADMIFRDLLETSDEEILVEAAEDGMDIKKEVERISSIISEASFISGKAKLAAAKKALLERKTAKLRPFHSLSIQKKKEIMHNLESNDNLRKEVTLAARNENELSEVDLEAYLQSLYDLKVIDEEGNALCD
jgi:hypothetical protein